MTRRGLVTRAAFALGALVVVNVAVALTTLEHDFVTLSLLVLCLAALVDAVATVMGAVGPVDWSSEHLVDASPAPTEGTLATYQRLLERQRVAREPDSGLQRQLLALAERCLEQRHGLTRDTDPDEVRARLATVTDALMAPGRLTPTQVNRIVDRIEEL